MDQADSLEQKDQLEVHEEEARPFCPVGRIQTQLLVDLFIPPSLFNVPGHPLGGNILRVCHRGLSQFTATLAWHTER